MHRPLSALIFAITFIAIVTGVHAQIYGIETPASPPVKVLVRIYPNTESLDYRMETVLLRGNVLDTSPITLKAGAVIVLAGLDNPKSDHPNVRNMLSAWRVELQDIVGKRHRWQRWASWGEEDIAVRDLTFRDALGDPIGGAAIAIGLPFYADNSRQVLLVEGYRTDDRGILPIGIFAGSSVHPEFRFTHSGYGIGRLGLSFYRGHDDRLPLICEDSPAATGALVGRLLLPDGSPAAGIAVGAPFLHVGGGSIKAGYGSRGMGEPALAYTNLDGSFRYLMATDSPQLTRGGLIPPGAEYWFEVIPEPGSGLLKFSQRVENGAERVISFPKSNRPFQIVFQDADGNPVPAEEDREIELQLVDLEGRFISIHPRDRDSAVALPNGTLKLSGYRARTQPYGEIVISDDSPDLLIFKAEQRKEKRIRGRAIAPENGQPIVGAMVLMTAANNTSISGPTDYSPAEWDFFRRMPQGVVTEDEARDLKRPLHASVYYRTDNEGRFDFVLDPSNPCMLLTVAAEGRIPWAVYLVNEEPVEANTYDVGDAELLPAATVTTEIRLPPDSESRAGFWPYLIPDSERCAPWFLEAWDRAKMPWGRIKYNKDYIRAGEHAQFLIPAGQPMHLYFASPYDSEWSPIPLDAPLVLPAGASLDVGTINPQPSKILRARLIDESGIRLAGLPIAMGKFDPALGAIAYRDPHISDIEGIAEFHVSEGDYGYLQLGGHTDRIPHAVKNRFEFDYRDAIDEVNVIDITVSPEIKTALGKYLGNPAP